MGRVFAYTRVSTIRQGEKGVSLLEQRDAILRYATQRGLEITRWFEEKETAAKTGRPAFTQMLRLLRLGNASGVIIHKVDRSARNLQDWADIGKLVDAGIEIHFANESLDMKTVSGRLSADIQAVVAAHYSRNLREEAKKGFYGRLKQGFYPLRAPIGYLDRGAAKTKTKDPVMAPLVVQAFELYHTGSYSLPQLAKEMYGRGLRNRSGGPVTINGLSTILTNPFYTGVIRLKKTREMFSANHEPLITQILFDEVQALLHGKAVDRVSKHRFTFSRLVRCAFCRYSLIAEHQKSHVYYRCHNRPFKNPPACPPTAIREEELERAVLSHLERLKLSDEEIRDARTWMHDQIKLAASARIQEIQAQQLKLDAVRVRLARLTDLLLDGTVEQQVFNAKRKELIVQEAQIKQQIRSTEHGPAVAFPEIERFVERLKNPVFSYKTADQEKRRELLKTLMSNLSVSGKNVSITLKPPFQLIAERQRNENSSVDRGTCRTRVTLLEKLFAYFRENPATLSGVDSVTS